MRPEFIADPIIVVDRVSIPSRECGLLRRGRIDQGNSAVSFQSLVGSVVYCGRLCDRGVAGLCRFQSLVGSVVYCGDAGSLASVWVVGFNP